MFNHYFMWETHISSEYFYQKYLCEHMCTNFTMNNSPSAKLQIIGHKWFPQGIPLKL